jgi:hypothetical protein
MVGCSKDPVDPAPPLPAGTRVKPKEPMPSLSLEPVLVPITNAITTLIGFQRSSPPPWKDGNFLSFHFLKPQVAGQEEERASWSVVNINAENFSEITRQLRIDSVEVLVLHTKKNPVTIQGPGPQYTALEDVGYALITDPRIPREWFLSEPVRGCDEKIASQLKSAYPKNFRASD